VKGISSNVYALNVDSNFKFSCFIIPSRTIGALSVTLGGTVLNNDNTYGALKVVPSCYTNFSKWHKVPWSYNSIYDFWKITLFLFLHWESISILFQPKLRAQKS